MKFWQKIAYIVFGIILIIFSIYNFLGSFRGGYSSANSEFYSVPMIIGISFIIFGLNILSPNKFSGICVALTIIMCCAYVLLLLASFSIKNNSNGAGEGLALGLIFYYSLYTIAVSILMAIAIIKSVSEKINFKNKILKFIVGLISVLIFYFLIVCLFTWTGMYLDSIKWDWKTYNNSQNGFELKIPQGVSVMDNATFIDSNKYPAIMFPSPLLGIYPNKIFFNELYILNPTACSFIENLGVHSQKENVNSDGNEFSKVEGNYCNGSSCTVYENYYPAARNDICLSILLNHLEYGPNFTNPVYNSQDFADAINSNSVSDARQSIFTFKSNGSDEQNSGNPPADNSVNTQNQTILLATPTSGVAPLGVTFSGKIDSKVWGLGPFVIDFGESTNSIGLKNNFCSVGLTGMQGSNINTIIPEYYLYKSSGTYVAKLRVGQNCIYNGCVPCTPGNIISSVTVTVR